MKQYNISSSLFLFGLIAIMGFSQCNSESSKSAGTNSESVHDEMEEVEEPVSTEVIENEASATNPDAKNGEPKFQFAEEEWDFGTLVDGEKVSHTFRFKNIGNADLVISSASASCGCTVPKHTKKPIPPGESGEIEVTFNSAGKASGVPITKDITVIANTNPVQTILRIKSVVMPANNK